MSTLYPFVVDHHKQSTRDIYQCLRRADAVIQIHFTIDSNAHTTHPQSIKTRDTHTDGTVTDGHRQNEVSRKLNNWFDQWETLSYCITRQARAQTYNRSPPKHIFYFCVSAAEPIQPFSQMGNFALFSKYTLVFVRSPHSFVCLWLF